MGTTNSTPSTPRRGRMSYSDPIRRRSSARASPFAPKFINRGPDVGVEQNKQTNALPIPENLGQRRRRDQGKLRKRRSIKQGQMIMRRFSFMRQPTNNLSEQFARRSREDGTNVDTVELGSAESKPKKIIALKDEEIIEMADLSHHELVKFGYNLREWEQIYIQLSKRYEKYQRNGTINFDFDEMDEVYSAEKSRINKWTLERALEKVSKCIESNDEYKQRQQKKLERWEKENKPKNEDALKLMRSLVPPEVKSLTAEDMVEKHNLSWPLAKRFVGKKVFQVLYMSTEDIGKIYPSDFKMKGRFDYTDLDIIELRAVYAATEGVKTKWRKQMKEFLYEYTLKEEENTLGKFKQRHHAYSYKAKQRGGDSFDSKEAAEEKERLTTALRSKAKCLFSELDGKSVAKKKKVATRVARFTGSNNNKYTRMVRQRLSLSASGSDSDLEMEDSTSEEEEEGEEGTRESFINFYTTGSFTSSHGKRSNVLDQERDEEDDSDLDDVESIERLVRQLSEYTSPDELERLLSTVLE